MRTLRACAREGILKSLASAGLFVEEGEGGIVCLLGFSCSGHEAGLEANIRTSLGEGGGVITFEFIVASLPQTFVERSRETQG